MSPPALSDRLSASERREAIVHAAQPLFAQRGFEGVTTREVAEAAGVSEALLYRHFDSKAALYAAVLDSCVERSAADARRVDVLPDSTSTLVLAVYLVARNIVIGAATEGPQADVPRLVLRSLLDDGRFARDFLQSTASHWLGKVERCVHAGIAAGEIEEPLEHAMTGLWLAHHVAAAIVFYRLPGEPVVDYPCGSDREVMLQKAVRFALRGIGVTPKAIAAYYQPEAFALIRSAVG
jgi:AcrR family transcriptional regulator